MPHFVVDCSENVLSLRTPEELIQAVYETAESTDLFARSGVGGIKVRVNPYKHYTTVGANDDFIHVFANIMEGRTQEQKCTLSKAVVTKLAEMFPSVEVISLNVVDFEKSTYCNRAKL